MSEDTSKTPEQIAQDLFQTGLLFEEQDSQEQAMRAYIKALVIQPRHYLANYRLALLQQSSGQPEMAIRQFQAFLEQAPENAPERGRAFCMVGQILLLKGFRKEAELAFVQALKSPSPDRFAHFYLGELNFEQQNWNLCLQHYAAFVKSHPEEQFLLNRAQIHIKAQQALNLVGESPQVWDEMLVSEKSTGPKISQLLNPPWIFADQQEQALWLAQWKTQIQAALQAEQTIHNPLWELCPPGFYRLANSQEPLQPVFEMAQALLKKSLKNLDDHPFFPSNDFRTPRLGIWCNYQTGLYQPLFSLIQQLCRDFQVILLSSVDPPAQVLSDPDLQYLVLHKDLEFQRKEILKLELDYLIFTDLGPNDLNSVLLAHYRLAPRQGVLNGFPTTSGIASLDFYLSSEWLEPPNAQADYSEPLFALEGLPYPLRKPFSQLLPRSVFQLPETRNFYLCPVSAVGLHPDYDQVLAQLLAGDPKAEILVLSHPYAILNQRLRSRWEKTIAEGKERLQLLPPLSSHELMSLAQHVDLILDPYYFGLGAQVFSFLPLGTPILTLPGQSQRSRYAQAALQIFAETHSIAQTEAEYLAIAKNLAEAKPDKVKIQAQLAQKMQEVTPYQDYLRSIRGFIADHLERKFF
ncbi:hypothetical protein COW36_19345 [bacterium (Candidatus Blackallbacteria) CG17_big_fil_post_rev_8_21_14_2_50_48_46]|uniref:Uncharacterized protein n=1 Tax=bacterium (Candidatus Blackallbacteria) CG17_big_fil_post_rev_8_21_14_2_50_48_46 TaxID=2014261 RepID=A0A2M7G082_9BACT|nr:MAG: hypothetical protein COW64_25125 [bacterium (Candidatus Blackallbacteria) CG18_big_fil_WC_8_21_14_2_50_49_26]PIW15079.1 MAG: hypothetical protein COW36_19345 [bacterium (Candidatus Blackallbacteria) CG17_big_fil_post_rev_8_21_14_2_50_48_46]PIW47598.1 MAG: hypothetical protein COW20_11975 [bacterium (Candidatus Blackallbacteria) CG13_big_fil_rev_8_21_14_2_50_49_14]